MKEKSLILALIICSTFLTLSTSVSALYKYPLACMDGLDNNNNGLIDCEDPKCYDLSESGFDKQSPGDFDRRLCCITDSQCSCGDNYCIGNDLYGYPENTCVEPSPFAGLVCELPPTECIAVLIESSSPVCIPTTTTTSTTSTTSSTTTSTTTTSTTSTTSTSLPAPLPISNTGGSGISTGVVQKATCYDGVKNQGEQKTDCGGPCDPCVSCDDGIQNHLETGIDCGGLCGPCPTTTTTTVQITTTTTKPVSTTVIQQTTTTTLSLPTGLVIGSTNEPGFQLTYFLLLAFMTMFIYQTIRMKHT